MWSHRLIFILLGAQSLYVACSSNKAGPPVATGATQNLTRNPGTTLFWVDEIGSVKNPYENKSVKVSSAGDFTAVGWAVDKETEMPAGGVDVVIDNTTYAATYGLDRPDVADGQKVPAYLHSGWSFSMPAAPLKGPHRLTIRIVSSDRKSYYEIPPATLIVE
jgi:hypothetical protein